MDDDRRDDRGLFTPRVSDEDVLEAIEDVEDPVATIAEVAERLPIGPRTTGDRLNALAEAGLVDRKTVGARAVVWWTTRARRDRPGFSPPQRRFRGGRKRGKTR